MIEYVNGSEFARLRSTWLCNLMLLRRSSSWTEIVRENRREILYAVQNLASAQLITQPVGWARSKDEFCFPQQKTCFRVLSRGCSVIYFREKNIGLEEEEMQLTRNIKSVPIWMLRLLVSVNTILSHLQLGQQLSVHGQSLCISIPLIFLPYQAREVRHPPVSSALIQMEIVLANKRIQCSIALRTTLDHAD